MVKHRKRQKWTPADVDRLRRYSKSRSAHLTTSMYQNILAGDMKYPRQKGFFQDMAKILRRSVPKCKSKFQKLEEQVYLETLGVPATHYDCFVWTRRRTRAEFDRNARARRATIKPPERNLRKKSVKIADCNTQLVKFKSQSGPKKKNYSIDKLSKLKQTRVDLARQYLAGDLVLAGLDLSSFGWDVANWQSRRPRSRRLWAVCALILCHRVQNLQVWPRHSLNKAVKTGHQGQIQVIFGAYWPVS